MCSIGTNIMPNNCEDCYPIDIEVINLIKIVSFISPSLSRDIISNNHLIQLNSQSVANFFAILQSSHSVHPSIISIVHLSDRAHQR